MGKIAPAIADWYQELVELDELDPVSLWLSIVRVIKLVFN